MDRNPAKRGLVKGAVGSPKRAKWPLEEVTQSEGNMTHEDWPNAGRRATIGRTGVIKSPSFFTQFPRIINDELIECGCRASMEGAWKKGGFAERDLEFFRIRGAYVVDEGLILDRDLQFIENASDEYSDEEIARAVADVRMGEAAKTVPHFDAPTIVTKKRAAHQYGHFLCEILPMGWVGTHIVEDPRRHFLIHRVPTQIQDVMFRSLRLLGVRLDCVIVQGFHEPMFFEDLLVIRDLTIRGAYMSPLCVRAIEKMQVRMFDDPAPGRLREKIFVRSPSVGRGGRTLYNEDEISKRLDACGYWAVEPWLMSLEQQIRLFRGATHVVGVPEAAMANIVFCRRDTKVTLLFPASFPDPFYWFIAQHRGLNYLEIRGDQTTGEPPDSWDAGFTIREKDIQYLATVRSAPEPR
jgi:capsular polysaccharide biosynthesis protein